MRSLIIGGDLALLHGACVDEEGRIIFIYQSKDGMKSTFESIYQRALNVALNLPERCVIVFDMDRNMASWGKGKKNSSVGSLLMLITYASGILARERKKADVSFIAPSAIRRCLGLKTTATKEEVHAAVEEDLPGTLRGKFHSNGDVRGDCIDAWILANTYTCTKGLK